MSDYPNLDIGDDEPGDPDMSEPLTQEQNLELQRNAILLINKIEALRQQLAAMTAERDEAVKVVTMLMETGQIMEDDIKWAEAFLLAKQHQGGLP